MSTMIYKEEKLADIFPELNPMFVEHWKELANHRDVRPLDPNYSAYLELNRAGTLRCFTVRDGDKLVGYAMFIIGLSLHYKTWLYAVCDIYYLDPAYRAKGIGSEMFEEIEAWLKGMGVKSVTVQDKINHSHEEFFKKLEFTPVEQHYEKVF